MRKLFLLLALIYLANSAAFAQQPQSALAPDFAVSASYVQGSSVGGYRPTAGAGLVLNVGPGTSFCSGTIYEYAGGTLTLTASMSNYVYLDEGASCAPGYITGSSFPASTIPIAIVTTSGSAITAIDDVRTMMFSGSGGGGGLTSPFSQFSGPSYSPAPFQVQTASLGTTGDLSSGFSLENVAATIFSIPGQIVIGGTDAQFGIVDNNTGFYILGDSLLQELSIVNATNPQSWSITPSFDEVILAASPGNATSGSDRTYFDLTTGNMTCLTASGADCLGGGTIHMDFGDAAGSTLTTSSVKYLTVFKPCTIKAWAATVDAGTITLDVWKIASGTAIPTVANTITAAALPAIASGTAANSSTLTGWTTSVSPGDIFGFKINAVATAKFASIDLQCQ